MRKNPVKAIVVDDERLPRLALLQKLEEFHHQVEVVDSCDNYDSALQSILRHQPDLLFLDIQLQGRDAMQLLDEVKVEAQKAGDKEIYRFDMSPIAGDPWYGNDWHPNIYQDEKMAAELTAYLRELMKWY